jgi:hypothetical protein
MNMAVRTVPGFIQIEGMKDVASIAPIAGTMPAVRPLRDQDAVVPIIGEIEAVARIVAVERNACGIRAVAHRQHAVRKRCTDVAAVEVKISEIDGVAVREARHRSLELEGIVENERRRPVGVVMQSDLVEKRDVVGVGSLEPERAAAIDLEVAVPADIALDVEISAFAFDSAEIMDRVLDDAMADQLSARLDENRAVRDFPVMKTQFCSATELVVVPLAMPPVEAIGVMIPIVVIAIDVAILTAVIEGEQVVEPMVVIKFMTAIGVVIGPMAVGAMVVIKPAITVRTMVPIKPIDIG